MPLFSGALGNSGSLLKIQVLIMMKAMRGVRGVHHCVRVKDRKMKCKNENILDTHKTKRWKIMCFPNREGLPELTLTKAFQSVFLI